MQYSLKTQILFLKLKLVCNIFNFIINYCQYHSTVKLTFNTVLKLLSLAVFAYNFLRGFYVCFSWWSIETRNDRLLQRNDVDFLQN